MKENEWKQYGLVFIRHKEPKFKVGEEVYFEDIYAEYAEFTIRKGKVVEAGDTETLIPGMASETNSIHSNVYSIESEGVIYRTTEDFISKDKKKLNGKDMTGE